MSDLFEKVELQEMVGCARRELAMRRKVYPRWVEQGKMTAHVAERETKVMEAIVKLLEDMKK